MYIPNAQIICARASRPNIKLTMGSVLTAYLTAYTAYIERVAVIIYRICENNQMTPYGTYGKSLVILLLM